MRDVHFMRTSFWRKPELRLTALAAIVFAPRWGCERTRRRRRRMSLLEIEAKIKAIDYSYIVWPNPPAIARIKYVNWYSSDKVIRNYKGEAQKKSGWMDRLAGTQSSDEVYGRPFELIQPYGLAVDSKGNLYVADTKVGAIFIFSTSKDQPRWTRSRTASTRTLCGSSVWLWMTTTVYLCLIRDSSTFWFLTRTTKRKMLLRRAWSNPEIWRSIRKIDFSMYPTSS